MMPNKTSPPTDAPHPDDWRDATGELRAVSARVGRLAARDAKRGTRAYVRRWRADAPGHAVTLAVGVVVAALVFAVAMTRASADTTTSDAAAHATALYGAVATQDAAGIGASTATPEAAPRTSELPGWLPAGVLAYSAQIHQAAADVGLDPLALALLLSVECPSGNAACTSPVGARGLAQVMPGTATTIEAATGYPCTSQPHDPLTSLRCGGWYFKEALKQAAPLWRADDESIALAAAGIGYNGGPGYIAAVVRHVQAGGDVCTAPAPAESLRWCRAMVDGWRRAKGSA